MDPKKKEQIERRHAAMVKALFAPMPDRTQTILHAAVGIADESGEVLGIVKKFWAHGKPLDREAMLEELGDVEFYLEALRQQLGVDRSEVLLYCAKKLAIRYPDGVYSRKHALMRLDKKEEE